MKEQLQDIPLGCKCGHRWMGPLLVNVTPTRFGRHLKTIKCPACGADWHSILFQNKDPLPAKEAKPKDTKVVFHQNEVALGIVLGDRQLLVTCYREGGMLVEERVRGIGKVVCEDYDDAAMKAALLGAIEMIRVSIDKL